MTWLSCAGYVGRRSRLRQGCAMVALMGLPAAVGLGMGVSLAGPAAAATVIDGDHASTVYLSNRLAFPGGAPFSITAGSTISVALSPYAVVATAPVSLLDNQGVVLAGAGAGIGLLQGGSLDNTGTITGGDYGVRVQGGPGTVSNSGSINQTAGVYAYHAAISLDGGGTVSNLAGGVLRGAENGVIANAPAVVDNFGLLVGAGDNGVWLNAGGTVVNEQGGLISGAHMGIYTGGGAGEVRNAGMITAITGTGVSLYGGGTLSNAASGTINAGYAGAYLGRAGSVLRNAGVINGAVDGVLANAGSEVMNLSGAVLTGGTYGVVGENAATDVFNAGRIDGVSLAGVGLMQGGTVDNAAGGVISGGGYGVELRNQPGLVVNAGSITGRTGVYLNAGGTVMNAGLISGAVGVDFTGGGAVLIDSGTIASTRKGGLAVAFDDVAGNRLALTTGARLAGKVDGGGGANALVTLSGTGVLDQDLQDFGAGGAVALGAQADWTGAGSWQIGQLRNDGVLQAGMFGNALQLSGDFIQAADGTLRVAVRPAGSTMFAIAGTARLDGGLRFVFAPGRYRPAEDEFLTAGGGISGGFSSTIYTGAVPAGLHLAVQNSGQALALLLGGKTVVRDVSAVPMLAPAVAPADPPADPPTDPPVAATDPAPVVAPVAVAVAVAGPLLPAAAPVAAVVAPADEGIFNARMQAMAQTAQQEDASLLGHATGDAAGAGCAAAAAAMPGPGSATSANGAARIADAVASGICGAGGWIAVAGTAMQAGASDGAADYHADTGGFLAGIDRPVRNTSARLGLAVGYDESWLRDGSGGKATVATTRVGFYAAQPLGQALLAADFLYGHADNTSNRATGMGTAGARFGGNVFAGTVQASAALGLAGFALTPAAGLRIADVSGGGFAETGAAPGFALHGQAPDYTSVLPYVNIAVSRAFSLRQMTLTPNASVGYQYEAGDRGNAVSVTAADGTGFAASGNRLAAGTAVLGAGIIAGAGAWALYARYSAEVAGNWSAQTAAAGVEARF